MLFPWEYFSQLPIISVAVGQARGARTEAETDGAREAIVTGATWYRDFSLSLSHRLSNVAALLAAAVTEARAHVSCRVSPYMFTG